MEFPRQLDASSRSPLQRHLKEALDLRKEFLNPAAIQRPKVRAKAQIIQQVLKIINDDEVMLEAGRNFEVCAGLFYGIVGLGEDLTNLHTNPEELLLILALLQLQATIEADFPARSRQHFQYYFDQIMESESMNNDSIFYKVTPAVKYNPCKSSTRAGRSNIHHDQASQFERKNGRNHHFAKRQKPNPSERHT